MTESRDAVTPTPDPATTRQGRRALRGRRSRRSMGRWFGLTALSTLLPGAGLTFTRRRRLGLVYLGGVATVTAALALWLWQAGVVDAALGLAASRPQMWGLAAAVVLISLAWIASVLVTARTTRPAGASTPLRFVHALFTAVLCVALMAPSYAVVRTVSAHQKAVGQIFAGTTPTGRKAAHTVEEAPWADKKRLNLLLLGSDAGKNRVGLRPDTIMVASMNTETGDTVIVSVPRNLEQAPLPPTTPLSKVWPDGYDCGDECLINGLWTEAEKHRELFSSIDDPGLVTTRDSVSAALGLPIDYTVMVNLDGFQQLVDAMGGVTLDVKERLPIGGKVAGGAIVPGSISGWIEPGTQHMDGYHALWYARSRATTNDFSRMDRQRCVVGAMVDQMQPLELVARYPQVAAALGDNIWSDMPESDLQAYVQLVQRVQGGTMRSLPLTDKKIRVGSPDYAAIQKMVQRALTRPASTPTARPSASRTSAPTPSSTPSTSPSSPSPSTTTVDPNKDQSTDLAESC